MEAAKVASPLSRDVDFRVRNTFIEWIPTPEIETKTLKKSSTWDGVLLAIDSELNTGEPTVASSPKEPAIPLLKSMPPDNKGTEDGNKDDQVKSPTDSTCSTRAASIASFAPDGEEEEVFDHKSSYVPLGRRPAKKTRRLCSKIIDSLFACYQDDEVTLSKVAWSLAAQHGYIRGLCLKYKIPQVWQGAADVQMPTEIQSLWNQVSGSCAE
eukprot:TRINITY_DN14787_c1_g1_i1.p1 TRINITY_DN14787_c1_g1~~TRINITY_DN14787_c1_g1_i1.p1  ORF type:complete len:211 (+),score=42.54 TRINITY_DN14787_c1_g1_i1:93-725(+)